MSNFEAHESEAFLPQTQPTYSSLVNNAPPIETHPKISISVETHEKELSVSEGFKDRRLKDSISSKGALIHFLRASLGSGILSMPAAFKACGLWLGVLVTILVAIVCNHCAYILVKSAHALYRKTKKSTMTYAEVAEEACLNGPLWSRKYAIAAKQIVLWGIFSTGFTSCSCYIVLVAETLTHIAFDYFGNLDKRLIMGIMFFPCLCIAYIPNLKALTPVSLVANIFLAVGLGTTYYYILRDIPSISERPAVTSISTLPTGVNVVIFAIAAIGAVMPIENSMKSPQKFVGICGVLNHGMVLVTILDIFIGFSGYLKYGEHTENSITLNLPKDEYAAQAVNLLIALAVFLTYGLVVYICMDILWAEIKQRFSAREKFANYCFRTVLVAGNIILAVMVPKIVPFVSLIAAFCFSILAFICPVLIELLTFWEDGLGKCKWKLLKSIIIIFLALLTGFFGSKSAIEDVMKTFQ